MNPVVTVEQWTTGYEVGLKSYHGGRSRDSSAWVVKACAYPDISRHYHYTRTDTVGQEDIRSIASNSRDGFEASNQSHQQSVVWI